MLKHFFSLILQDLMIIHRIAVSMTTDALYEAAQQLATRLDLPLLTHPQCPDAKNYTYLLLFTPHYLGLQRTADKKIAPFYIDFLAGKLLYRSQHAGRGNEMLARAIGLPPRDKPRIVDATAGLGRDSFILATLGFNVTMLERSPILHALLEDALIRAKQSLKIAAAIERLQLINCDARIWLKQPATHTQPDIIYLDPMFPERKKSASVKKEMAILQDLLGKDEDSEELFYLALSCAGRRVVVKRPRLAPNIAQRAPDFSMSGKSSRFDIYLAR